MYKNFWGLIWASFNSIQGILIGFLAIILALGLWVFSPNTSVSLVIAAPIGFLFIIFIFTFGTAAYRVYSSSKRILPEVLFAKSPTDQVDSEEVLCLLGPSELFSYDSVISFYYISNENFEQFIGIGTVMNIQEDGKIQVMMTNSVKSQSEIVKKLTQNDAQILKRVRVKPFIPKSYLDMFRGG